MGVNTMAKKLYVKSPPFNSSIQSWPWLSHNLNPHYHNNQKKKNSINSQPPNPKPPFYGFEKLNLMVGFISESMMRYYRLVWGGGIEDALPLSKNNPNSPVWGVREKKKGERERERERCES